MIYSILPLSLLVAYAAAHSTKYNVSNVDCTGTPPILSFHTHIVFMLTSDDQLARAEALRDKTRAAFTEMGLLGEDCTGRYDNGRLCLIYDHPINETLQGGPFPVGEWSMFVPVSYYAQVIPWFTQNHDDFSLLVHPNTGCEYEDHDKFAQWTGDKWPLDFSIFDEYTQTNEFDAVRGDEGNPVCLAEGDVCGGAEGPSGPCCEHNMCACKGDFCQCVKV